MGIITQPFPPYKVLSPSYVCWLINLVSCYINDKRQISVSSFINWPIVKWGTKSYYKYIVGLIKQDKTSYYSYLLLIVESIH